MSLLSEVEADVADLFRVPEEHRDLVREQLIEKLKKRDVLQPEDLVDSAIARHKPGPRVYNVRELLTLEIPVREHVLHPIIREKETVMLHASRGVGKTHVGLQMAYAIASGGEFLGWHAPRPRRVLYIDGEMPGTAMQERLASIVRASPEADTFDPVNLQFVCADFQDGPVPNLSTPEGQRWVDPYVDAADVVVIDSISTLASYGRENEAESWMPMQAWALDLRRRGKTVLLLHHDGKNGQQRGTSRREDILDVVIGLRHPGDYEPSQGARFEVHFDKARGIHGDAVAPFEASLVTIDGHARWTTKPLEDARLERAANLLRDGCSPPEVALELGVSRATAYRLKNRAHAAGLVN